MKKKIRVGVPRALAYYTYYPLWKTFLEGLGAIVVLSGNTNRRVLEDGIRETVNDACIPIKVFHGHVRELAPRVDYIFVPRLVNANGKDTFCPKFLGLPDMVRFMGSNLPPLVDTRYKRSGLPGGMARFFWSVAAALGVRNPLRVAVAAIKALAVNRRYMKLLAEGLKPPAALEVIEGGKKPSLPRRGKREQGAARPPGRVAVALLGYPYAIFDPYISAGIYQKLLDLDVDVFTYEQMPPRMLRRYASKMPQNFFWHYSNRVCWAGLYLLDQGCAVDGIIHITAFGCGPDAMVDKTLELEAKNAGMPFLSLAIDEHTGEGGVQTRLEAFVDMLRTRKRAGKAG